MVRVFIVAEVKLFRDGLAHALAGRHELQVAGTATDVDDAAHDPAFLTASIVLLDTAHGSSLGAIRALRQLVPQLHVVALALNESREDEVLECIQAGVSGYVPPNGSLEDLIATVERVGRGELICPPRVTAGLARRLSHVTGGDPAGVDRLTQRERQVAGLIDRGMSNKEIARTLHIETATVKNHIHSLMEKLSVHRRHEAVARLRHTILPVLAGMVSAFVGT